MVLSALIIIFNRKKVPITTLKNHGESTDK